MSSIGDGDGCVIGGLVSADDDEGMRQVHVDRLQNTLMATTTQAEQSGLTPDALDELLSDES
ncbi:hypothetical protein ACWA7J_05940 [Leptothrix sp. BB-4]